MSKFICAIQTDYFAIIIKKVQKSLEKSEFVSLYYSYNGI